MPTEETAAHRRRSPSARSGWSTRSLRLRAAVLSWTIALRSVLNACGAEPDAAPMTLPPLPAPRGEVIRVATVEELLAAVDRVQPASTILVADGHYRLPRVIVLEGKRDLALRGASADAARVTLTGRGWDSGAQGDDLIHIGRCDGVTIADLTFADCRSYGIKVEAENAPRNIHIYRCCFRDIGVRAIKGSAGQDADTRAVTGSVRGCTFENTRVPPADWLFGGDYIAAIDMMALDDWTFSDNVFRNIQGRNGGARAAIFIWVRSRQVVVERNRIVDCDRGIAFGNPGQSTANSPGERLVHVADGVIRNNFIAGGPDCGIELWHADHIKVLHNTIWRPERNWARGIRVGTGTSHTELVNNLVHGEIRLEGGEAEVRRNLTGRLDGYFVDPAAGNLALTSAATGAIDQGAALPEVSDDIRGHRRSDRPDLGAWERSDELEASATPAVAVPSTLTKTAIAQLIQAAGTTDDELERLRLLRQLEATPGLNPTLRGDLGKLLPVVDDWANGKSRAVVDTSRAAENGYLCRFLTGRVRPAADGPVYPPELTPGSPLRPIWCLYRGRMLIWQVIQSGPLLSVRERREKYYSEGRRLLEETRLAFPENRVARMYLGEPIPWPKPPTVDPEAPAWANLQREGLGKLADVIHWWVAERQLPDGQFGGGWGDDVEMWRWWTPVLIAFDDPVASAAQERLSSGIFEQPHLREGFTSRVTDVEHSNEDTTDTILPMMHLRPDDPVWKARALRLAELTRDRWTGRNQRGFLQFRSIYFSVDKVDTNTARAFDTVYHPSVIQPALLYWQRTGDPALTALFGEWLKVWVDAAARAENGKPSGVLPSAIRWPEGGIARTDLPWWEPFPVGHNDALYNWPGAMRLMTSTLLLAGHMTRDACYLEPIHSMAALRLRHWESPEGEPGSEAWCARRMSGFLPDALAKHRLLTGDTRHDPLLRADASGYVRYRLTGDRAPLESALRRNAEAFRSNWEAYTSEMRWTDRVMSFTRNFLNHLPEAAPPAPSPEILYNTATGDPGNPLVFPLNAVRWRTPPRDIAALVTESGRTTFAAELFHFGDRPRDLEVELYLLSPGEYALTLTAAGASDSPPLDRLAFRVEGPRVRVPLQLPARRLCVMKVGAR